MQNNLLIDRATANHIHRELRRGDQCDFLALAQLLLTIAEWKFGARSPTQPPLQNIVFDPYSTGPVTAPSDDHTDIILPEYAKSNGEQLILQLAHECLHALSIQRAIDPTNLEEGLATWFGQSVLNEIFPTSGLQPPQSYQCAWSGATQLLNDTGDSISRLRKTEPCISKITAATFTSIRLTADPTLIAFLVAKFPH